jgi:hypothetical protein
MEERMNIKLRVNNLVKKTRTSDPLKIWQDINLDENKAYINKSLDRMNIESAKDYEEKKITP